MSKSFALIERSQSETLVFTDDEGDLSFPSGYYNQQKVNEIYTLTKSLSSQNEVVTRTYEFSTEQDDRVSVSIDLAYPGHWLLGAGVTRAFVYNLNSVSTTWCFCTINGTTATISAATGSGAHPKCAISSGIITAYYIEE